MNLTRTAVASLCLSAAGLVYVVGQEGYCGQACIPVKGDVPTLGFGTTEGVKLGDRTTPHAALGRTLKDVSKFEGAIKGCVEVPLYQYEYDAYTSLAYNIGPTAFCNSTLVKKLNDHHYRDACMEITRWDKFKGKPLAGLTARREGEKRMCLGLA